MTTEATDNNLPISGDVPEVNLPAAIEQTQPATSEETPLATDEQTQLAVGDTADELSAAASSTTDEQKTATEEEPDITSQQAGDEAEEGEPKQAKRQLTREERQIYEKTIRRFQVCGRCGYLLADCRLALGEDALKEAILTAKNNWVDIPCTEAMRPFVMKAFGVRLDQNYDYYDGICPECRRRYVFSAEEETETRLSIQL